MPRFSLKTLLIAAAVAPLVIYLLVKAPALTSLFLIVSTVVACLAVVLPRVTFTERCQITFVLVAFFLSWLQPHQLRSSGGPTVMFVQLRPLYPKDITVSNSYGGWSSMQFYYDAMNAGALTWIIEMLKQWVGSSTVPAGFAIFPRDLLSPPREWAERFFNVARWTEMPRGGHFAAMEEPELLAEDIRAFFRPLRG